MADWIEAWLRGMGRERRSVERQEQERRTVNVAAHELRVKQSDGGAPIIEGYAALFNTLSEDLGGFYERIKVGAFSRTLTERDVRGLWNHDPLYVLGRGSAGTLRLGEDDTGLQFEVDVPDTQWARDLLVSIRRGDVREMSFQFSAVMDEWAQVGDQIVRTLIDVDLYDISVVTFPAYPQTSASVRSKMDELLAQNGGQPQAGPDAGRPPDPAQGRRENLRRRLELAANS